MSKELQAWFSPTAYGICMNVEPSGGDAAYILTQLEPAITKCDMCDEEAVRVGIFETSTKGDKPASEFRGLCERHKQFGMWSDADTAWGWD